MAADFRRAALTLHSLAEHDRDWVLRRLDPHQQSQIEQHLGELGGLGIVADARLVEQALRPQAAAPEPGWREAVRACDALRLHEGLRHEPAALMARVLNSGPWPWEAAFLALLEPAQRARVAECRQGLPSSRELDVCLLHAVVARLELPAAAAPEPRSAPWLRCLAGAISRVRRSR